MPPDRPYLSDRLAAYTTTIFAEMSALALATGSINLGQGFPDVDGPLEVIDAAIRAIRDGKNQYPPGIGVRELREAISAHEERYYGLRFDPDREVLVTAGATEAIAAALIALCDARDEVVLFEPYYDSYAAGVAMAGATRRVVTLHAPDWSFDFDELERAITDRTRCVIVNSPHNPTGKVFSRAELEFIAQLCLRHDVIAITDEVYEHLIFDDVHIPLATLPDMADRTLTVSSTGKTFSVTGWKVGWACATPELLGAVKTAKQFLTYVNAGPFQYAIAEGLTRCTDYVEHIAGELREKRDLFSAGLAKIGFGVFEPHATFFVMSDVAPLGQDDGAAFCWALPERCGVVAIPASISYDDGEIGKSYVRFAFCKRTELLHEAIARLSVLGSS